jgi:hypothetical protein
MRFRLLDKNNLLIYFLVSALLGLNLSAYAYNNDYHSSTYQDSYSQSWQSYKQQNNIKTETYVQQSWWSKTVTNVNNFLANIGAAINRTLNNIGSFFTNAYNSIKNIFVKAPVGDASQAVARDVSPLADASMRKQDAMNRVSTKIDTNQDTASKTRDVAKPDIAGVKRKKEPELAIAYFARVINAKKSQSSEVGVGDGDASRVVVRNVSSFAETINQKDVSIISPKTFIHKDPGIMPVGPIQSVVWQPSQTGVLGEAVRFYGPRISAWASDMGQAFKLAVIDPVVNKAVTIYERQGGIAETFNLLPDNKVLAVPIVDKVCLKSMHGLIGLTLRIGFKH